MGANLFCCAEEGRQEQKNFRPPTKIRIREVKPDPDRKSVNSQLSASLEEEKKQMLVRNKAMNRTAQFGDKSPAHSRFVIDDDSEDDEKPAAKSTSALDEMKLAMYVGPVANYVKHRTMEIWDSQPMNELFA